jgi:DHA2 family multidrug resistance protein-like MFS transporter
MAFIWQIRRTGHPLLPPTMFKNERFTLAAFTSMIAFVSQGITFIALPFLFQSEYGYSPVVSALLFTPWPLGIGDCAACRPLGGHDISPGDIHSGAGDICRRFDPAGDVTRQPFNVGYLPAKSGVRNRVWLLSESQ